MPIKKLASGYFNKMTGKAIEFKYTDCELELPHLVSLYHDLNVLNLTKLLIAQIDMTSLNS